MAHLQGVSVSQAPVSSHALGFSTLLPRTAPGDVVPSMRHSPTILSHLKALAVPMALSTPMITSHGLEDAVLVHLVPSLGALVLRPSIPVIRLSPQCSG